MKKAIHWVLLALSVCVCLGIPVAMGLLVPALEGAIVFMCAGGAWLIFCPILNGILSATAHKKLLSSSAEQLRDSMCETAEKIRADSGKEEKRLRKTLALGTLYSLSLIFAELLLASGLCMICHYSMLLEPEPLNFFEAGFLMLVFSVMLYMAFAFYPVSTIGYARSQRDNLPSAYDVMSEKRYPALYALAKRASDAVGCKKKFFLMRSLLNDGISVSEASGTAYVWLPPALLAILTEEEFYQILLHEFAHEANADTKLSDVFSLAEARYTAENHPVFRKMWEAYYAAIAFRITTKLNTYRDAASIVQERAADETVFRCGNAQIHANGLAKSVLYDRLMLLNRHKPEHEIFAQEKPFREYYRMKVSLFEQEARKLFETEREIMLRTLPARNDSHPTFAQRLAAHGVTDFDPFAEPEEGDFRNDALRFVEDSDEFRASWDGWKEAHEDYLEAETLMSDYEKKLQSGEEPDEEESRKYLITAYQCRPENALKEAERLHEKDAENCFTNYVLGLMRCIRDDERGIALAIETAKKYFPATQAMEAAGDAVLRTGKQELLDEYRAEQAPTMQKVLDYMKTGASRRRLTVKNFRACDLPEARIEAIRKVAQRLLKDAASEGYIVLSEGKIKTYAVVLKTQDERAGERVAEFNEYLDSLSTYAASYLVLFNLKPSKKDTPFLKAARRTGTPVL